MPSLIFTLLFFSYLLLATAVAEWKALLQLGYRSHVPPGFLQHPMRYVAAPRLIWIAAACCTFTTGSPPLYKAVPALLIALPLAVWLGRRRAFHELRTSFRELLEHDQDRGVLAPARRDALAAQARMSNREFAERMRGEQSL